MVQNSQLWICSSDLKKEWESFSQDCSKNPKSNAFSDLWLSLSQYKETEDEDTKSNHPVSSLECSNSDSSIKNTSFTKCDTETDSDMKISLAQHQQIISLAPELVDAFELGATLSGGLKDEVNSLSPKLIRHLLSEMAPQLSEQGVYNICTSLTDSMTNPWIDVHSVIELIILPLLCGDPPVAAGAELLTGISHLSNRFPSLSASSLLKPLLSAPSCIIAQLELVSRLVSSLPSSEVLSLLRDYFSNRNEPLQEWQLSILNIFLMRIALEEFNAAIEDVLFELIQIFSASVSALSASESFGSLLLKMIKCFKCGVSPKVCAELSAIVQQTNSYSKRALLSAIKCLQSS